MNFVTTPESAIPRQSLTSAVADKLREEIIRGTIPEGAQLRQDAIAMQYFCMHTAVDVVNKAVDMVGGSALARRLPLERYYRDVRSGPIHPIGGYDALEVIGKHAFGIPRDSEPRWV